MGEWKDGERAGNGSIYIVAGVNSGDKYVGDWEGGGANGHGIYTYADGREYIGQQKAGKRYGQGTHT